MKLCIISHYPPIEGGISKYTKRTVELMRKEKVDVTVIPVDTFLDSIKILPTIIKRNPDITRLEFAISMYRLISLSILLQLLILKLIKKTKIAANFHEVSRDTKTLGIIGIIFYKRISFLFDFVSVHTKEAKKILINNCNYKINKIKVFPHGLYLPENTNKKIKNYKNNKKIVLYFGYIHKHKGIEYLLYAYKMLLEENAIYKKTTKLVIAGSIRRRKGIFKIFEYLDIKYFNSLNKNAERLGLKSNISFLGFIKDKDLDNLFNKSYVFVLPYIATEQSGVLHQLLPYNKPIIASSLGGIKETLQKSGILVEPKNIMQLKSQLNKLYKDSNYYSRIIKKYKKLIKELNPKNSLKLQLQIYK